MSLTINLYYTGKGENARKFVEEMEKSGLADKIRKEKGNEQYDYFFSANDSETVLLIDTWSDQAALNHHHESLMMKEVARLREKYDLHMKVRRYRPASTNQQDKEFIRE